MDKRPSTPRVYDAINFNNELAFLEVRLATLDPEVDCFVICESHITHSGKPKPLYYLENKDRYAKWNHKIFHYIIEDGDADILRLAESSPNVPKGATHYLRDFYQKESVKKGLIAAGVQENDICYVSDCDEIWKPKEIGTEVYKLRQTMYAYYFNNKSSEKWAGTFVGRWQTLADKCFNHLRQHVTNFIEDGGWHFTNIGDERFLREKIEAYSAQEFNTDEVKSLLETRKQLNQDYLGRNFTFTEDYNLPQYLLENKEKYGKYFR